jgi:hypothetical protein
MERLAIALAGVLALAGCAGASADTPIDVADQVTRAVYGDDLNGTVAHFDDGLRAQVKTEDVDQLSHVMRDMGSYRNISTVSADNLNRRYDYQAAFDRGSMLVQMRFDPDGRVAAYRVTPIQQ